MSATHASPGAQRGRLLYGTDNLRAIQGRARELPLALLPSMSREEEPGRYRISRHGIADDMKAVPVVQQQCGGIVLRCKTKGFLRLVGRDGMCSEYERWRIESEERQRIRPRANLLLCYWGHQVNEGSVLIASRLVGPAHNPTLIENGEPKPAMQLPPQRAMPSSSTRAQGRERLEAG